MAGSYLFSDDMVRILEAMEFMKLNPGEAVKYDEYWAEASVGEEQVSGKDARAIFSRASKVSKTQLRLIWEIADHRREGCLDRSQFLIALRLIALAQRGAEISVKGLRNFVGIHLVPSIEPAPSPLPAEASGYDASRQVGEGPSHLDSGAAQAQRGIVWTVELEVLGRYDNYFVSLDAGGTGYIDGSSGVAFFGKSGLPRPVLKRVWQLADVTRDGKLDRDEFRAAMHMVAALRTGRASVADLPQALDRRGPFWLRSKEEVLTIGKELQPEESPRPVQPPSPQQSTAMPPSPTRGNYDASSSGVVNHEPILAIARPSPPPAANGDLLGGAVPVQSMNSSPSVTPISPRSSSREDVENASELREKLRMEHQESQRAQRELELMKAEMEELRLEKAKTVAAAREHELGEQNAEVEQMRRAYQDVLEAKSRAEKEASQARSEAIRLRQDSLRGPAAHASSGTSPKSAGSPRKHGGNRESIWTESSTKSPKNRGLSASTAGTLAPAVTSSHSPSASLLSSAVPPTTSAAPSVELFEKAPVGSPPLVSPRKRSADMGSKRPASGSARATRLISDDSMSESDDDDFWGSSGTASKPTLGKASAQTKVSGHGTSQGGSGFGNDLDEWAF